MVGQRIVEAAGAFAENARTPNLRRAQASFGAAFASEWAFTVAIGIYAYREGGAAAVGVVAFARMVPSAVVSPFVAVVADRMRRERLLTIVGLVRALAIGGITALVATGGPPVAVYALAAAATVAFTLFRPAHSALLPSLCTTATQLTAANVVRGLLDSLSVLLGPLAATALLELWGLTAAMAFCGLTALASGLTIARVDYEAPPRLAPAQPSRALRDAVEGFVEMRRRRELALVTGLGWLQAATRGAFTVFVVVMAVELLDMGEGGVGVLTAAVGIGAVLGSFVTSLLVSSKRLGSGFGAGIALWGLPFMVIAGIPEAAVAFFALAFVGAGNAFVDVNAFTVIQRVTPDNVLGRFCAAFEALITMGVAVGALVTPAAISLLGIEGALLAVGAVTPVATIASWPLLRAIDRDLFVSGLRVRLMQRVPMLAPLPLATIEHLASRAQRFGAPAGAAVIKQGEPGERFYVIADGEAEVLRDGRAVGRLGRGDCFGEIAVLQRCRRTTTVRAASELHVYVLQREHFVTAVTGYTPSRAAADEMLAERMSPPAGPVVSRPAIT